MRITILALGSRGDVQPFVVLGRGLMRAGHQVKVATFRDFAPMVTAAGLAYGAVRGDAHALLEAASQNGLLTRQNPLASLQALRRSYARLGESLPMDLMEAARGSDLLLNQLPANLFGPDLAEYWQIPLAQVAVIPLAATASRPLFGFPRLGLPGYNRLTYILGAQIGWQLMRRSINRWRMAALGLPARSFWDADPQPAGPPLPLLAGFSPRVAPRQPDWGEHIHVTGWWLPEDDTWQPPLELQRFLEGGLPPVFIGFGSMPVADPTATLALIGEAARQAEVRVVLGAGWAGLGRGSMNSPDVFSIPEIPYAWLFPRLRAIMHHGGSGTTGLALHSGVPSCVIPFGFDQFYWGERSAALGVGPRPLPFRQLSVTRLAQRLHALVSDPAYESTAQSLGAALRGENGVQAAVKFIDRLG